MIVESQIYLLITEALLLSFRCGKLQVQVPEKSDIKPVEWLSDWRVVTSFEVLAGEYFGVLGTRLRLASDSRTKITYVRGSVEAACALTLADGVVDLVKSEGGLTCHEPVLTDMRIASTSLRKLRVLFSFAPSCVY